MCRKSLMVTAAIAALAGLPGCFLGQQTDFATDISGTAATFHARVNPRPQGIEVYFEYWPSGAPGAKQETTHRQVGPDAVRSFDERVTGLNPGTDYSFRVCGVRGGAAPSCAQVLRLRAGAENVQASGASSLSESDLSLRWDQIDLNAFGDPLTGRAFDRFTVNQNSPSTRGSLTEANLTCINVSGHVAVVGFKDPGANGTQYHARLDDNGPAGSNQDEYHAFPSDLYPSRPGPTECNFPLLPPVGFEAILTSGDVAISDIDP